MPTKDELFRQLMQQHNASQTPGEVLQQSLQTQQEPQEVDNWQNPDKMENQWLYKMGQPVYEALTRTRPGATFLGAGEGIHQNLQSAANLFRDKGNKVGSLGTEELVNPDYSGYHTGGKLGGNLLADYLGMKGIGTAMRGATGMKGLLGRMGATGAMGYLTGEHFPEWLGGRKGAAALGAAFPVTAGATAEEIGKNITRAGENAMGKHGAEIGEAAAAAKNVAAPQGSTGIAEILAGKSGGHILHEMDKIQEGLGKFFQSANGETAQEALSLMKKRQRELTKGIPSNNPKHLGDRASAEYYALQDAIQSISSKVQQAMSPKEWQRYADSLQEYATKAAPYSNLFGKGKASKYLPKTIGKMAEGGKVQREQYEYLMNQHPELFINKHAGKFSLGGLATGGVYNAKDIMDYFGSKFGGGEHE